MIPTQRSDMIPPQRIVPSPLGSIVLVASDTGLRSLHFCDQPRAPTPASGHAILDRAAAEVAAYFAGELREFSVPLEPQGTEFQLRVWKLLAEVGYAETRSYVDLARGIGQPSAARAVGSANARNPLALILPCHRIIATSGALTGYAGGLERKRWLLEHERRVAGGAVQLPLAGS